ncbi:hypothetical protein [Neolewinella agarilytica]|uniref:Uncharacterized protein n=1 Tax=Neolewinella agarilytica TaxID=478744 RepID=A0A1H9MVU4_9BACT|nr:hypothetical protein [Neolewinella agarilytica]SER27830.1 hypothetical protein SAMN05444359_1321 [Neolewinella agarilytica]
MKRHLQPFLIRFFFLVFITAYCNSLVFAQETMDYKLRAEQNTAGYRNIPIASDTALAFRMIEVVNEKGCDTLIYLIGNDRREDFRMPYDNGIHSKIKSLIVQKVLSDSLCVCELLDHLGLYVSDHGGVSNVRVRS